MTSLLNAVFASGHNITKLFFTSGSQIVKQIFASGPNIANLFFTLGPHIVKQFLPQLVACGQISNKEFAAPFETPDKVHH